MGGTVRSTVFSERKARSTFASGEVPGYEIERALHQAEGEHEARKEQKRSARHPEIARERRNDDALHANDEADKEHLQHLQAELSPIHLDATRVGRHRDGAAWLCPHAVSPDGSPAFAARSSAASGGAAGMFSSMNATKRSASAIPKAAL